MPLPSPASVQRLRWWRPLLLAGAGGAVAAALLLLLFRSPTPQQATLTAASTAAPAAGQVAPKLRPPATLRASPGTRFTRESGPPHERVHLHEGRLIAEVTPARAGESFRIVTARVEVEVRGTVFVTVASAAGLQAVRVQRGGVAVRPADGTAIRLGAGQLGQRPGGRAAAVSPPPAPSQRAAASPAGARDVTASHWRKAEDVPRPSTGDGSPITWPEIDRTRARANPRPGALAASTAESAFGSGLDLLRAGRHAAAADAFDQAAALAPGGPLAEDAWYWRAVALGRWRSAAGRAALAQFLDRYPFSARRGAAAVMLGWLLFAAGDVDRAGHQFRVGLADRSARVRASAQAGMARLSEHGAMPR
jgi:TolA-binding protein